MPDRDDVARIFYEQHLQNIGGIKFTRRQVDVIACLVSGWNVKSIALRLSISPSTVESHLEAIAQKLGSGGRHTILTFIEKSSQEKYVRQYYQQFITGDDEEKTVQEFGCESTFSLELQRKKQRRKIIFYALTVVFIICASFLYPKVRDFAVTVAGTIESVRSEFFLPHHSVLLQRLDLLAKIDQKLKGSEKIQTVALVGIGGAGKTTLARQYAKSQKMSVVWEINAETKESLINSFTDLAMALAQIEEEKYDVRLLREIRDSEEREKCLFLLVKRALKTRQKWLLIYDNVETLQGFWKYLPQDPAVWGQGHVIVTTRDDNVKNYLVSKSNSVLRVPPLSLPEKARLFRRILSGGQDQKSHPSSGEELYFLNSLPPFPLDVSTAAYYIKDAHVSFETYLKRLQGRTPGFDKAQKLLLKEFNDYTKTRFGIITLTLDTLMEENPNFKELLLLISVLDSQDIPVELLKKSKPELVVENFIHHLRKYSFITSEQMIENVSTLSLHRSVQAITLTYLNEAVDLLEKQRSIQIIGSFLQDYLDNVIEKGSFSKIKLITNHISIFLKQDLLLKTYIKGDLFNQLGWAYYLLNQDKKAKKFLQKGIDLNKNSTEKSDVKMARSYIVLGAVHRRLGEYFVGKQFVEQGCMIYGVYYGKKHIKTAWSLVHLGNIYEELGNYEQARNILEKALGVYEQYYGMKSIETAWILVYLGKVYTSLGNLQKAQNCFKKSLVIHKDHFGDNHLRTAWSLAFLGSVQSDLGNYKKAQYLIKKALKTREEYLGENNISLYWHAVFLGKIYRNLGKFDQSHKILRKIVDLYTKHYGLDHIKRAYPLYELGQLYLAENRLDDAEAHFQKPLNIYKQNAHSDLYKCFEALGDLYVKRLATNKNVLNQRSLKQKALDFYKQSILVVRQHFSKDSPHLERLQKKLKKIESLSKL